MARGQFFWYGALYHPKEKRDAGGNLIETPKSIEILPLKSIVASSKQEVMMIAARELPAEYIDKLDDVDIAVDDF